MEYCKFGNAYFLRIQRGEELLEVLTEFCRKEKVTL